jgi:regulator of ribosome biosynthesis
MKRISENEKKRQQNIARASGGPRQERKTEIEKTLATTKISTASMGKFDKRLDGEKRIRGVKRKVRLNGKTFIFKKEICL